MKFDDEKTSLKSQRMFNLPPIIICLVAICCLLYLIPEYLLSDEQFYNFLLHFSLIPKLLGSEKLQFFYTPLTYSFLHGSFSHIFINMLWLVVFGSPLANRLGMFKFGFFWALTAIIAGLFHYCIYPTSMVPLVGASGAISGMMGAAARYGFKQIKTLGHEPRSEFAGPVLSMVQSLTNKTVLVFISIWLLMNVATGLYVNTQGGENLSIAWEAHIGGMAAGFFLIGLLDKRRNLKF